jgi:hypothetical protein
VLAFGAAPLLLSQGAAKAALSVSASTVAADMATALLGPGAKIVPGSATYIGAANASGFFSGDTTIFGQAAGVGGVLLTSGSVNNALPPNNSGSATQNNGAPGSAYLNTLISGTTLDASTLTFKVTLDPGTTGLEWTYVFGSEEYNEYVNSSFNDVFALSLNGTNLALIPSSSTPVSINNVNNGNPFGASCTNCSFFRNNPQGTGTIHTQYDGLTTVLKSTALGLKPGVEYTLSFAIADTGDDSLDSGVFVLGGSIKAPGGDAVPGPLPILGAGVAFGWSRRLRRRIESVTG